MCGVQPERRLHVPRRHGRGPNLQVHHGIQLRVSVQTKDVISTAVLRELFYASRCGLTAPSKYTNF